MIAQKQMNISMCEVLVPVHHFLGPNRCNILCYLQFSSSIFIIIYSTVQFEIFHVQWAKSKLPPQNRSNICPPPKTIGIHGTVGIHGIKKFWLYIIGGKSWFQDGNRLFCPLYRPKNATAQQSLLAISTRFPSKTRSYFHQSSRRLFQC